MRKLLIIAGLFSILLTSCGTENNDTLSPGNIIPPAPIVEKTPTVENNTPAENTTSKWDTEASLQKCLKLSKDVAAASWMTESFVIASCYSSYGINTWDVSICDTKTKNEPVAYNACISQIAETTKDEKLCAKLPNESTSGYGDICYGSLAKIKKDIKICDPIKDPTLKTLCTRNITEADQDDTPTTEGE